MRCYPRPPRQPPTQGDHETLYDVLDASEHLGIAPSTIRSYIIRGVIPAERVTRIGGRYHFTGHNLAALVAQRPPGKAAS